MVKLRFYFPKKHISVHKNFQSSFVKVSLPLTHESNENSIFGTHISLRPSLSKFDENLKNPTSLNSKISNKELILDVYLILET